MAQAEGTAPFWVHLRQIERARLSLCRREDLVIRDVALGKQRACLAFNFPLFHGVRRGSSCFAMVHCACSSPLFAQASAWSSSARGHLRSAFGALRPCTASLINGRKSEFDPQRSFQKLCPDTLFRLRDHANWGGGRLRSLGSSRPSPFGSLAFGSGCAIVKYEIWTRSVHDWLR